MESLIRKRGSVKSSLTRITSSIESHQTNNTLSNELAQGYATIIGDIYAKFDSVQTEIEETCEDESLDDHLTERSLFYERYCMVKVSLLSIGNAVTNRESSPISNVSGNTSMLPCFKLPRLNLPTFEGNYKDWPSFYDLFGALVARQEGISEVQRLQYLKGCLKGEPYRMIQSLKITEANFREAWQMLISRYENKRQIVRQHMKELFSYQALSSESINGLRRLTDSAVEHIRSLKVLGRPTDFWDDFLVYMVSEKLDNDSKRQWALHKTENELPTFSELIAFMEARCRALKESTCVSRIKTINHQQVKNQRHVSMISSLNCPQCENEHPLTSCDSFKSKTIDQRREFINKARLCFNCMRSGHISSE